MIKVIKNFKIERIKDVDDVDAVKRYDVYAVGADEGSLSNTKFLIRNEIGAAQWIPKDECEIVDEDTIENY
jgi:hypothetical protein